MCTHLIASGVDRSTHATGEGEIAAGAVLVVAATAVLVIAPTLAALTHGWDYRLAVMLGTILAAALARVRWRTLPEGRVADRVAAAFAGTFAAGLFCTYAADWLDWRPLGIDDAVAGTTIGLLILAVPVRRLLQHAARVPAAAGLTVVFLAALPAAWATFVYVFHSDGLDPAARYALIERPGFAASLALTGLGFAFALRRGLYPAAAAMSAVAWVALWVLLVDGGASMGIAVVAGGIVGTGLMIVSANAWARSARDVPGGPSCITVGVLAARTAAFFAGPARRALRAAVRMPSLTAVALAALALAPACRAMFPLSVYGERLGYASDLVVTSPSALASLVVAGFAFVLAHRRRLYRTAIVTSAFIGTGLFALLDEAGIGIATSAYVGTTVGGGLLLATATVWRAFEHSTVPRPSGLLGFLVLAAAWALLADIGPFDYIAAAAALGVWWWSCPRDGERLFAQKGPACSSRRQPFLRLALAGTFGVTLVSHLVLLQAAVLNQTGPMLLVELRERGLYAVSELTFARAMLADQYLWRDAVSPPRPGGSVFPDALVAASRHERDRWSHVSFLWLRDVLKEPRAKGYGIVTRDDPNGRRVHYVYRGSPAERAGVRRGDVIRAIDGMRVAGSGGVWAREGSTRLELIAPGGEVREVMVEESGYREPVIGAEKVFDVAGRRVGYLELHLFRKDAAEEFRAAAGRLREQGIDELVLDLRMNPGGYLGEAWGVASAIAGERLNGKLFTRVVSNERYRDRDLELHLGASAQGALGLARLFVVTSKDTCSASESLINGLAAHMPVVTVGETTCGKPVGSLTLEYGEHVYSIITFRGVNARGEGDYFTGLPPTCATGDDVTRELGDPADPGLGVALHYIRYGGCPRPAADSWDTL